MIQFTMNIFLIDTAIVLRQSFTTIKAGAGYGGNYFQINTNYFSNLITINQMIINIDHFRPVNVPLDIFSEEIQFYELGESAITKFR